MTAKNYRKMTSFTPIRLTLSLALRITKKNGWTEKDERDLLDLLDYLDSRNTKFALSNVTESKGKKNHILQKWLKSRKKYKIANLNYSYKNSNYQRKNKESQTKEVLITNC